MRVLWLSPQAFSGINMQQLVKRVFLGMFVVLLLGGPASCNRSDSPQALSGVQGLYLPDLNRLFEDYEQLDSTNAYGQFAYKLVQANRDLQSSELYVEAASLYQQSGPLDSVALLLHKAIDRGMANPNILSKLNIPEPPDTVLWEQLQTRLDSVRERVRSVDNFSFEIASMNQFWPYFERARNDPEHATDIFKEFIFLGPVELRDYYAIRYLSTGEMYGQMINASPRYYSFLKKHFDPERLQAMKEVTSAWMVRFKEIYPQAVFPKVYVVPGLLNSGGTATEMGLFVGGDMYGKSNEAPLGELTDWQQAAIMEASSLPTLSLHELMHFQQNYADPVNRNNLLFNLVQEGVCDLLVELCSGEDLRNSNLTYLQDPGNRERILAELKQELYAEDLSKWMYNGGSIQDRPHDLGYTLGYLITKSYYSRQDDKQRAIYELLNSRDLTGIVKESDYAFLLDGSLL